LRFLRRAFIKPVPLGESGRVADPTGPAPGGAAPLEKIACNSASIETIWPQLGWYLDAGDFDVGVQTKRGCPHNCC
jgi:radical SAM superfamily enzyme YgiQ (UPF0313 family)